MAKIKLDLESTDTLTFDRTIPIPTPDGKNLKITFTFKYRDREQVARFFDTYREDLSAFADVESDGNMADRVLEYMEFELRTIMEIACGWNIEAPWEAANVRKLLVKYAGSGNAILGDYRVSLLQGRVGN